MLRFRPLFDMVLIKTVEEEKKDSLIVIPDSAKDRPVVGDIVAVGGGRILDDGSKVKMSVEVGNRVYFTKYSGTEIELDGIKYLIMRENDIIGIYVL